MRRAIPWYFTTGYRRAARVATRCGRLLQRLCWAALVARRKRRTGDDFSTLASVLATTLLRGLSRRCI